ncbi:hypothetical protein AMJ83_08565 [candidate division WOR_3 bacterium SM23_42]|uniref:Uncharacterized protein n=1 Tax=candidate division WOR_3 bacterium SM23_42 TaxID=1703779 RepID=A0A0S8FQX1_UNCW3|nr:MAG: hypothetical protein AMJ83_08565 [candidate division WOR_3 bacterium SM23_42]
MEQQIDLKRLERKVWTSFYADGLWDIFLGCIILMFALAPFLNRMGLGDFWSSAAFVPFWAVIFALIVLLRRYVVIPRLGLVSFGQTRRKRLAKFNILIFVALSVSLILGITSFKGSMTQSWVHNLRFIAVVLICFGLAGYFLGVIRLYIYGLLIALCIPIGEWLHLSAGIPHHGFPVTFGITSSVIILTGVILFLRLLRENPRMKNT